MVRSRAGRLVLAAHGDHPLWSGAPAGLAARQGASGDPGDDQLQAQAAEEFAGEVAARRVPSVRLIRSRLDIGQSRAQRVGAYLASLSSP